MCPHFAAFENNRLTSSHPTRASSDVDVSKKIECKIRSSGAPSNYRNAVNFKARASM